MIHCVAAAVLFFAADEPRQTLWKAGDDGYAAYRIPAIVRTPDDSLLAFCEGRKQGFSDQGDIDLMIRRSTDNGIRWTPSEILFEEGGDAAITIGNPCPINDPDRGLVHLLYCRDNHDAFYVRSDDNGQTWSDAVDLAEVIESFDYDVKRVATGPGHGLITSTGDLVVPVWLSNRTLAEKNAESTFDRYRAGVMISRDGGDTWEAGGVVPATVNRLNESMAIELKDGRLLLNSRSHDVGYRTQAISDDGGRTWHAPDLVTGLPDATAQASLLRHSDGSLLFSNIPTPIEAGSFSKRRRGLTFKRSTDDARTWDILGVIEKGPSAYSDLVELPDGDVLCLFECGVKRYAGRIDVVRIDVAAASRRESAATAP